MVCKYCNEQNEDNAKFCKSCGKELSGTYCPQCNTHNVENAVFCKKCGARLDGRCFCLQCGRELEPDMTFCPECGSKCNSATSAPKPQVTKKNNPDVVKPKGNKFTNAMRITSLGLSIGLASIVIIFTILMGTTLHSSLGDLGDMGMSSVNTFSFFDFFGDVWKNLSDMSEYLGDEASTVMTMNYLQAIFGLLICVGTLVTVLVCGIMGIVKSAKSIKSGNKTGIGHTFAAFFTYVAGATALVMVNAFSLRESAAGESYSISVGFDTATTAGLAVGGVLVGLCVIAAVLSNGTRQLNKGFIVNGSLSLGSVLVGAIFVGLCVLPFVTYSYSLSDYGVRMKESGGIGFFMYMSQAASIVDRNNAMSKMGYDSSELLAPTESVMTIVLGVLAFVVACYVIVRMANSIATSLQDVNSGDGEEAKGSLGRSIELLIMTCVLLGLTIGSFELFKSTMEEETTYTYGYGPVIGLIVLAVINLGIEIARKVVRSKMYGESEYQPSAEY